MTLLVRSGHRDDLPEVVDLYNHYVETSPATFEIARLTVADRLGWLEHHTQGGPYRLLVAEDGGGALAGWASSSAFRPRAAYATTVEASVYCQPSRTGQGVGTRLYAGLLEAIADEDVERVVAGVTLPNAASLALHRRFGFRHVGTFTRVGRKFGRYWDVAWFERPARLASGPADGGQPPSPAVAPPAHGEGAERP